MATRSFFFAGNNGAISANNVAQGMSLHGRLTNIALSTSPSYYQYRAAVPLTLSNLQIIARETATGTGRIVTATLNEVNQSPSVTFPDTALTLGQAVKDTANNFSVVAGDKVGLYGIRGSGTMLFTASAMIVAPGQQAIAPMLATGSVTWTTVDRRIPLSGDLALTSSAAMGLASTRVSTPGNVRGLFCFVSANASTGAAVGTLEIEVDGVASGLRINVGVGETGYFLENTTIVPVAAGKFIDLLATGTTGNSVTVRAVGATVVSDGRAFDVYDYHFRNFLAAGIGAGLYLGVTGGDPGASAPLSNLAAIEYPLEFPARLSRMAIHVRNYSDVPMVADVLLDGAPTGITIAIPISATAVWRADDVNSVGATIGQKVAWCLKSTGANPTTGGVLWYSRSLQFEDLTPLLLPKITFHG